MFYFLPQSYENNLKAQYFCYKKTIKALLSIADGRAASFFNTFIKIITPPPFLRAAEFRLQRYEEKPRYVEKFREKPRNSEKIGEIQRKSEKN